MALRSAPWLLLVLVAVALWDSCVGASSHSLKYFYSSISDPSQGLPQFVAVGYVDDQLFSHYDSNNRKVQPRVSWMEKVGKDNPQYWDRNTRNEHDHEEVFREGLENLRRRYNQSEGLHTWQEIYGCELRADGSKRGFDQYGYDGRTFITFDKETSTWVASEPQAQMICDALPADSDCLKSYLETICIEWLEKHLSYGKETLLRTGEHLDPGWTFLLDGQIFFLDSFSPGVRSYWHNNRFGEHTHPTSMYFLQLASGTQQCHAKQLRRKKAETKGQP